MEAKNVEEKKRISPYDDEDDEFDFVCYGMCGKGFYYHDEHYSKDYDGITAFWCCDCYEKLKNDI